MTSSNQPAPHPPTPAHTAPKTGHPQDHSGGAEQEAAWRRRTAGERRWPVSTAILVAIVLQLALPDRLGLRPGWLLPALEAVLLTGRGATGSAGPLLANGAAIYATNVLAFALWYWDFDRSGPVARAAGTQQHPDFLFPQMSSPELSPKNWEPLFLDYLYLSFTNATAFSPTDTMPMTRWAKVLMALQSSVALILAALVIARAVNILK